MRRILVTGANKGIGLAIAKAILEEHDDTFVYLGSRDLDRGRSAVATLPKDRAALVELDVASDASVERAAKNTDKLYAIVNNAGIGSGSGQSLAEIVNVNTRGIHRVSTAFLPLLDPRNGRIVNVTSASGPMFVAKASEDLKKVFLDDQITWPRLQAFIEERIANTPNGDAYGLSKALANSYTMMFAREHPNLRVNACTPGFIDTDMTRGYDGGGKKPPSAGARAPMHLLFAELEGNGWYYGSDAVRSPLDRYREPGSAPYTGK